MTSASVLRDAGARRRAEALKDKLAQIVCGKVAASATKGLDRDRWSMRVAPTAAQARAGKLARIGYDRFNPDDRLGFVLMVEDLGPEVSAGVRYGRTGEPISIEVGPELVAWAHERVGLDVPRARDAAAISKILKDAADVASGWIAGYLSGSEASSSCKDDDEARELARVMTAYGDSPKPVWERALSISAFSDSKALAARGWDARIVRAAASQGAVDASAPLEAALSSLGILRNPPAGRLIGGDVSLEFADGRVDLRSCGLSGFSITEEQAARVERIPGTRCVLEVENLTCFHELCRDPVRGVLVVYGGGFALNDSFEAVVDMCARSLADDALWLAWSDIDVGGFEITTSIMERYPAFEPFLMDRQTLESIDSDLLLKRERSYLSGYLAPMLDREEMSAFHDVAATCLGLGATLEQEVLLSGRVQNELRKRLSKS